MKQRKNLIIFLFLIVCIVMAIWLVQIMSGGMPYTDQFTRELVDRLQTSFLYDPFRIVTNLGSEFFLYPFVIIVMILLFIWFKDWLPALFFAGGTLVAHLLNRFIKSIVDRERPSISVAANAEGYSFPSGHAMVSMVCYGMLAYFITKKLTSRVAMFVVQVGFSLLIFLIGISRYIINVHYLTDVFFGFFVGYLVLIGLIYLYEFVKRKRSPSRG